MDVDKLHFAYCPLENDTFAVAITAQAKMEEWQSLLADFPGIRQWLPEPLLLPWQAGEWCLVLEGDSAIIRVGRCEGFSVERNLVDAAVAGRIARVRGATGRDRVRQ